MQKTATYSRLVHFLTVRTTVSEMLVKDGELVCPSIVLLSKNQLWTFMDFSDQILGLAVSNNGVALDNM